MSAVDAASLPRPGRDSLGARALRQFLRDRTGLAALAVVVAYLAAATGVWLGAWGADWGALAGGKWEAASARHWFGTNIIGQDIFARTVYSTSVAFEVGLVVALAATAVGAIVGALAGYWRGSLLDELLLWAMGVLDAIPFYLFVAAVAFALQDSPWAMQIGMVATFWIGTARLVRGEVMKLRGIEYVEAARVIGLPSALILLRHVLPNTSHILLVQASIAFVSAIKTEVILSFLGIGIRDGVSWGLMIEESTKEVLAGFYNNFLAASLAMFGLVMAFNAFADALQDALDPRKVASP